MLGGAMGLSERDSGAVIASHATNIMNTASIPAIIQPRIFIFLRKGVGVKLLGGPRPKLEAGGGVPVGRGSGKGVIGSEQTVLYESYSQAFRSA
ncbi:hypothetical protein Sbs19_24070 [Sphingobium sp. BS19]|nr:hypothetical protein Sbs19_24070 [Sphingobium sp. BS19]